MALKTRIGPVAAGAALGLLAALQASTALAAPPTCSSIVTSLGLSHVIYGAGGSAIEPTLAKVALQLSKANPPINVFFADASGAQPNLQAFLDGKGTPGTSANVFKFWRADADLATPQTCVADDLINGQTVDFATTGGSPALFGVTLPAEGVGQFRGPTQGINVIVPKDSTESAISAEALYFVFGFGDATQYTGATSPVPWTDPTYIFQRKTSAFAQQFVRGAIQTLGGNAASFPAAFKGTQSSVHATNAGVDSNQASVDSLVWAASQGHAQNGIAFTSGPTADKNRASVRTLAYQHIGQNAGYWPDSSPDAFDKINIRTGQYYLWDTNLFYAKVSSGGVSATFDKITNADVKNFIGYFIGALPQPADADVLNAVVSTGSIPLCAMQVQREGDFGPLSCFAPPAPCGCYFEATATGSTPASCDACTKDADCKKAGATKCHYGFCEAY